VFAEAIDPVAQNAHKAGRWLLQGESRERLDISEQVCLRHAEVLSVDMDILKSVAVTQMFEQDG